MGDPTMGMATKDLVMAMETVPLQLRVTTTNVQQGGLKQAVKSAKVEGAAPITPEKHVLSVTFYRYLIKNGFNGKMAQRLKLKEYKNFKVFLFYFVHNCNF